MNICISSAGRRVALVGCFRDALHDAMVDGRVFAVDCSPLSSAFHRCDAAWQVPRCTDPGFIPAMLEICQTAEVSLLVPTIDTELPAYSEARDGFAAIGVLVAVSSPETIRIAADKRNTHQWLQEHGFPTVRQAAPAEVLGAPQSWTFPVVAKPLGGSAGLGVQRIPTLEALGIACAQRDDLIIQELAIGDEYTINVFVDRNGKCRCAVPHRRLEVRAGEVSKGLTCRNGRLMELARAIVEKLPGARGALNVQCFLAEDGTVKVIEINPRFGGGYPLAHAAGAKFALWLVQEALGLEATASFDGWEDRLLMLRYDDAVFLSADRAGLR